MSQTANSIDKWLTGTHDSSVIGSSNRDIVMNEVINWASKVDSTIHTVSSKDCFSGDWGSHGARDDVDWLLSVLMNSEDQSSDLEYF